MGKKSPPKPPDPQETAAAQTGTNVSTAVANAYLNNTNQYSPYRSLEYNQSGTHAWTDPSTGSTYQIPTFSATQQLSPYQAAISRANEEAQLGMANLAAGQTNMLQGYLGQPMSYEGVPERPGIPGQYDYSNFSGFSGLDAGYADGGDIQKRVPIYGALTRSFGDAGDIQRNVSGGGEIQRRLGDTSQAIRYGFGDAGDITRSYGPEDDFSSDRQRVEDALMARLNPYLERDREALRTQLSNQGIKLGSEAYDRGMADFGQQSNDARFGAILNAGTEQQRMMDMAAQRAGFENAAQQQAYNQEFGRGQFANTAQQQEWNQLFGEGQFANQAQAQQFGQNMAQGQFTNQAQQQAYNQLFGRAQFQNQAELDAFNRQLAAGQFANAAQGQEYMQDRTNIDASNNALQTMYDNYFRATAGNNQLQDSRFNQDAARYGMETDSRNTALSELYTARNQPINEIAALLSGAQLQAPQFVNTPQYQIPTTDYAGIVGQNYNQQFAGWQQQNQQQQQLMGGLFGLGAGALSGGYF